MRKTLVILTSILVSISLSSQELSKKSWKIIFCSSEERNEPRKNCGKASAIIDRNTDTYWTSEYREKPRKPFPHTIIISLGGVARIHHCIFQPRLNAAGGKISDYEIQTSLNMKDWTTLIQSRLNWATPYDNNPIVVKTKSVSCQYLKLIVKKAVPWQDTLNVHLAEFSLLGNYTTVNTTPSFTYSATFSLPANVRFTDTSLKKKRTQYQYFWKFEGGIPSTSNEENPQITFPKYGIFQTELTLKDSANKHYTCKKRIKILPAPEINKDNWKIISVSDEDPVHSNNAKYCIDNNEQTLWHTSWVELVKLPHQISIDLGAEYEIQGIGVLPRIIGKNGIFKTFRVFLSKDAKQWNEVLYVKNTPLKHQLGVYPLKKSIGRYLKIKVESTYPANHVWASCSEIYLYGEPRGTWNKSVIWTSTISICLLIILLYTLYIRKRKAKGDNTSKTINPDEAEGTDICLFGKLQIHYQGKDYAATIFPKIKQIFSIICIYTIEKGGISTTELTQIMWPNLSTANASNSRSSSIFKLRSAIENVKGISVEVDKNIWFIRFNEGVKIDLCEFKELYNSITDQPEKISLTDVQRFISIIEKGTFLSEIEQDWMDNYQTTISEKVTNILKILLNSKNKHFDNNFKLHLCDLLFIYDELSIEALKFRIRVNLHEKNPGTAKKIYDSYGRKYKSIYNEEFSVPFSEISKS